MAMSTRKVSAGAGPADQDDVRVRRGDTSAAQPPAVEGRTGLPGLLRRVAWSDADTSGVARRRGPERGGTLAAVVRTVPFTTAVVLVVLVVGIATGSLWTPVPERTWFPDVAYGLPSLTGGAWWTPLTGSLLALSPVFYLAVIGSFLLFVGFAEWRLGTRRTALICVVGQLVGVLAAAATLLALRHSGWHWAEALARTRDVGFSAGALACITVATAAMRSPWRLRVRAGLVLYVTVALLFQGSLADLEHFWAVALALPLSRLLAGDHAVGGSGRFSVSRREWRLIVSTGLALIGAAEVVLWLSPAHGLFGPGREAQPSGWDVALDVAVVALVLNGLRKGRRWAWWCAIALGVLNVVSAVTLLLREELFGDLPGTALAIAGGALWLGELVLLVVARRAFRAPFQWRLGRRAAAEGTDQGVARDLLLRYGGSNLSWMVTWPENSWFRTGDSVVAYQRHAGVAVALGDPVGPRERRADAIGGFTEMCERTGTVPCLFSVTADTAALAVERGWQRVRVADDTVIDLDGLEFRGKKWQDIRSALNRAAKEGIDYREVALAEEPWAVRAQVRAISEQWVGDKGLPEMGFTLGGIDEAMDPAVRVGLAVDGNGSVHGVTSWLPVFAAGGAVRGWTLDVTRRRSGGFRPVSEFLIASACLAFQAQHAEFVSLSGAPLAHAGASGQGAAVDRLLDLLGAVMEPHYGFRSLHAFKTKFSPRYEPLYLAYRDEGDLARIGIALTRAYLPDATMRDLVKIGTGRGV
jgi:phosphatidylglycerol lysyltransferase